MCKSEGSRVIILGRVGFAAELTSGNFKFYLWSESPRHRKNSAVFGLILLSLCGKSCVTVLGGNYRPNRRLTWIYYTVSLWDNRVTAHTAISDYDYETPSEGGLRHGFRIATLAEKPMVVDGLESVW